MEICIPIGSLDVQLDVEDLASSLLKDKVTPCGLGGPSTEHRNKFTLGIGDEGIRKVLLGSESVLERGARDKPGGRTLVCHFEPAALVSLLKA